MPRRMSPRRMRVRSGYRQRWSGGANEQNVGCLLALAGLILTICFQVLFQVLKVLFEVIKWCIKHPKQAGLIFLVLITIIQLSFIINPSADTVSYGDLVFAWLWIIASIICVAIWATIRITRRTDPDQHQNNDEQLPQVNLNDVVEVFDVDRQPVQSEPSADFRRSEDTILSQRQQSVCTSCGSSINDDHLYCVKCGTEIEK